MKFATIELNGCFKGLIDYNTVKFKPGESCNGRIELRDKNDHLFMYVFGRVTLHQNDAKDSEITIELAE